MLNTSRVSHFLNSSRAYNFLMYRILLGKVLFSYGKWRHRKLLQTTDRSQCHTYTKIYRSPGQIEALVGPVMDHFFKQEEMRDGKRPFHITVCASSRGAETYTFASALAIAFPNLKFEITASDLHQDLVDEANKGFYTDCEVKSAYAPASFIAQTFDRVEGGYQIKTHLKDKVRFIRADLLNPAMINVLPKADLLLIQNVLFHLPKELAYEAFDNVAKLLKDDSCLFIDGMELDMREAIVEKYNLNPLNFKLRQIHDHACRHVGVRWWTRYYGLEPYKASVQNPLVRYGTIFFTQPI